MDAVLIHPNGKNLEVYVNNMIVKTMEGHSHIDDRENILKSVRRYNMRLSLDKFPFEIHVVKFLGFMLTRKGIEANPDKFHMVIDMSSPTNMKEV